MTIQSSECTHCGELWRKNYNRDVSYEWNGERVPGYNPWTKFVAWELCKNNLEELFPRPKPAVVEPKPVVKPDPTPSKPTPGSNSTSENNSGGCTGENCNSTSSKTNSNEKESSTASGSTVAAAGEQKVIIPLLGLEVTKTGSYYIYGGIILLSLMCCSIIIITCICMRSREMERRKSIRLEKELQMRNE